VRGATGLVIVLAWLASASSEAPLDAGGSAQVTGTALPPDVDPVSRNRLPSIKPGVDGAAAIRLHLSGVNVRWASPLGRQLTELAILTAAREHDQPYEWSLHEVEALAVGLDPAIIDVVRHRRAVGDITGRERIIIETGREIFGTHKLGSRSYARTLEVLGKSDLVDIVDLMATYSATAARLTAFNQHMPPGWKQFLPLPFTMPGDIHPDSRSRLPLIKAQSQNPQANLYARQLAPEGTGPAHIARHSAGLASLESRVGAQLMGLTALVAAREHDAQYQWTLSELAALKNGLDARLIDIVRHRGALNGLADREAAIIQFGRELFDAHNVRPETYARALKVFGEQDLVDLVNLMAQHSSDAVLLAAFDQHLPAGQKGLLPIADGAGSR
jgi:alkylhydroperoxidase family enzyme